MAAGAFPPPLAGSPIGSLRGFGAPVVHRGRLTHLLDLTGETGLASVVAPPGSGKRTLVRGWLDRRPASWAWAVLAASDDNPRALARRLRDATGFAADDARGASNDAATVVIEHSEVMQRADTIAAFDAWLAHTAREHRVIVIGEVSVPPLARARGRRSMVELRALDLQFTRAEIDELVARRGLPALPSYVHALLDITSGWAAPVDFATRCLVADSPRGFSQTMAELRDFAVTAVLPALPDDVQCFVRELACTEHAEVHLVAAGQPHRPRLVQQALDRQLLVAADGAQPRLALHPYLAWALRPARSSAPTPTTPTVVAPAPAPRRCPPSRNPHPVRRPSTAARRAYQLTRREADVLALMGSELTMREIAATLCVSRDTVKSHSRSIYRKLSVTSREAAVTTASAAHLLE
jgi:ATP/maltotriose-dependent transcriptional regulator MalT